ncbi:MAG: DUF1616 domain-containing protein [Candidatus Heimdallarchaeaceae archaeon]
MNQVSEKRLENAIIEATKKFKPKNVDELITIIRKTLPVSQEEIITSIVKLHTQGKIKLIRTENYQIKKLTKYLKTTKSLWYWITILTATITAIVVFLIPEDLHPWIYIRYVLGTIFVLWLPGYTFIKALFPDTYRKTKGRSLDTIERIALSIGMSLALVPIVGLFLNYTPWGIRLTPIMLSLLALTIIFATAALIRQYRAQISF